MKRDQFFQELFNRPPTPEEQHRFDRLSSMMNLSQDDSMWYVILVNEFYDDRLQGRLKDIETVANSAAKAALVKIADTVHQKADELAASKSRGFLWRTWGLMVSLIVLLGAICVNAGYVMGSGRFPFWLSSPSGTLERISGYFLNVPSGWILLIGSTPFFFEQLLRSSRTLKSNARLGITEGKGKLVMKCVLSLLFLSLGVILVAISSF